MAGEVAGYERLGQKKLSLIDVIAQSIGFMGPVFSAAFLIPLIAGIISPTGKGAGVASPFAVIVSAIGVFALGWIVAEYAKRVHAAGSLYDYVSQGLGPYIGSVAGCVYYGGTTVLASAIAVLIGGFIHDSFFTADPSAPGVINIKSPLPGWLWSVVFVVAAFLIMYLGVKISTRAQLTLSLVSVTVVGVFFIYVIAKVGGGNSFKAFDPSQSASGWSGIFFGVLYGVLIFVGFETAANLAEETAEPKRAIPRAVLASVVVVTIFYVIAAYTQVAGFGFDLKTFTSAAAAPLFALASPKSLGGYGSSFIVRLMELVVLLDVAAVGLGAAVASTRGIFALARDRRVPAPAAAVSPSRGTPVGSILVVSLFSLAMVALMAWTTAFGQPGFPEYFSLFAWLSSLGGFALVIVYAALALSGLFGLTDAPAAGRLIFGVLGLAIAAGAVFGSVYQVPRPTSLIVPYTFGWLVLGIVVTLVARGRAPARETLADLRSGAG